MSVNKVILVGHLGKDPEVQTFESGVKKVSFTLATNEKYKKEGEPVVATEWHNIVCWNKLGEIAENYLRKGKLVFIEGKLKTRSWEEEGKKRYITEIEASNFTMLSSGGGEGGSGGSGGYSGTGGYSGSGGQEQKNVQKPVNDNPAYEDKDDLPF